MFEPDLESLSREDLNNLQLKRLQELVSKVYNKVGFYKTKLEEARVSAEDIKSLDDIKKLPFTRKVDLRDNYPFNLLAVPLNEVQEIHASSGTTGKPTVVAYTKNDIKLWGKLMARCIVSAGGSPQDVIQNSYGYGLFTGGLGVHYGALELGATIVPTSVGGTKRQLQLMKDFGTTFLTCTPSYSLYMAEEAANMGIDIKSDLKLKIALCGAEPWTEEIRMEIEDIWNIFACDIYGLSEIIGPGVANECPEKAGLHIFADHFLPEIINPETGEHVAEGEDGELVITTLTKEALPLIRYKTGDIVSINYETCACGRTLPRISKIKGRTDDMLVIRGINVFPSQIESVLLSVEGVAPHYQMVVDRVGKLDQLEIQVEVDESLFTGEIRKLEELERNIAKEIESVLIVQAKVSLVEPRTIQRSEGKAKRVIDKRKQVKF